MESNKENKNITQDEIFESIKKQMKEQKITQKKLAKDLNISVTTLIRYFKKETPMPLNIYLEICEVVNLNPS